MSAITSLVRENIGILSGSKTTDDCMWRGEGGEEEGRSEGGEEGGEGGGREGRG